MDKKKKAKGSPISPEKLYTVEQLAESLSLSTHTIREKAREGKLPCTRHFGRFYFLGKEVIEAIRKQGENLGGAGE